MSATKYLALANTATSYAKQMTRLRNRIFGEVTRPLPKKCEKVIKLLSAKPADQNPELNVSYYPRHVETHLLMKNLRFYGLFRDEHQDFKEEMKRLRKLRGKEKPKKGEGKRASKK